MIEGQRMDALEWILDQAIGTQHLESPLQFPHFAWYMLDQVLCGLLHLELFDSAIALLRRYVASISGLYYAPEFLCRMVRGGLAAPLHFNELQTIMVRQRPDDFKWMRAAFAQLCSYRPPLEGVVTQRIADR